MARIDRETRNYNLLSGKGRTDLWCMKSAYPERNFALQQGFVAQFRSLPFDDFAATTFGSIRAALESQGNPIGPYDLQIAAIALSNDLTLVTHNVREFSRVDGLRVEDWEAN